MATKVALEDEDSGFNLYKQVKRLMTRARHYMDPVAQMTRGYNTLLRHMLSLSTDFLPKLIKFLHYLPYISSAVITIDNLRRIAYALGSENLSTAQRIGIITHAVASIALTIIFTVMGSPYAGLLASTITDLVYHGGFRIANRIYKHYFGSVETTRNQIEEAEKEELQSYLRLAITNELLNNTPDQDKIKLIKSYLSASYNDSLTKEKSAELKTIYFPTPAMEARYEDIKRNRTASNTEVVFKVRYEESRSKFDKVFSLQTKVNRSAAKLKENYFIATLAAVAFAGALLLLIPGMQLIGGSLLAVVGTIYLADKLFPIPFPWRRDLKKMRAEDIKAEARNDYKKQIGFTSDKRIKNALALTRVASNPTPASVAISPTVLPNSASCLSDITLFRAQIESKTMPAINPALIAFAP